MINVPTIYILLLYLIFTFKKPDMILFFYLFNYGCLNKEVGLSFSHLDFRVNDMKNKKDKVKRFIKFKETSRNKFRLNELKKSSMSILTNYLNKNKN